MIFFSEQENGVFVVLIKQVLWNNLRINEMNVLRNIPLLNGIRQIVLLSTIVIFFIFTSCAGSQSSQSSKHRKPVSKGKRKCGCSMLIPSNHVIKLYHNTYYVLHAWNTRRCSVALSGAGEVACTGFIYWASLSFQDNNSTQNQAWKF